jgi:tetratricopeptide (TPR) repeat protein
MKKFWKKSDTRKTQSWKDADREYSRFHSWNVFSIFGATMVTGNTPEELDQELAGIIEACPEYFPAWFHRGEYMLRNGENAKGEDFIEKAFDHMINIIENEEEFNRAFSGRIDNLEKLLRYDLAVKYLEKAIRIFPDTARYYDEIAFYTLYLPDRDNSTALGRQLEALEIDPDNDYFINNLGWIYLMMGNFHDALEHFQKSLRFNPDNSTACENLEIAEYMAEHRINYFEYLVRPVAMGSLNELLDAVDFEGLSELCHLYKADRREAFKIHHLKNKFLSPHEILNILQPLQIFMNTLEKRVEGEIFLYENMELIHNKFKYLLFQFLLITNNIDELMLDSIGRSLIVFYDFLRESKLVNDNRYKQFAKDISTLIKEFSGKIDDFYSARHDVTLSEQDRRENIRRLFGIKSEDF